MSKKRTVLILNRKSAVRPDVREIVKSVEKELGLAVYVPWSRKQLRKILRKAVSGGATRVVAGGGDGTLNKVASAILGLKGAPDICMGLVPLGTANDFARSYGDMGDDLETSLRRAVTGDGQLIDVGLVNGKPFVNVASGGFGAKITATTPLEVKKLLGGMAYSLAGVARISELAPVAATVALDGGEERHTSISVMAVGNSRFAGGGFEVTPDASVTDGLLDLATISTEDLFSSDGPVRKMLDPEDGARDLAERAQFKSAVIRTETPFHINLDGEPIVDTAFEISVLPGLLRFVLP